MTKDQKTPRHPGTESLMRWLTPNPNLPYGLPTDVAHLFADLASKLTYRLPDGPELTAGLRKLLEAKDCMVRAAIDADQDRPEQGPGITISQFERAPGGWSRADRHQA